MSVSYEESILTSLRKITRAIDLYSHQLARQCNLTGPQLVCIRLLGREGPPTPGHLARAMSLSQATVTGILDRLDARRLIERARSADDRRKVIVSLSPAGLDIARSAPSPLQERFAARLAALPAENRAIVDTVLRQVVNMMEASDLDAAPILHTGDLLEPE